VVSAGLIALGKEPMGTLQATFADWPALVARTYMWRVSSICLFALVLAAVVQFTRYILLRREHREHTLETVHR
jgi:hypothetical protein